MKVIHVRRDDTMNDIDCIITNNNNIIKILTEKSISQGDNDLELLYTWSYEGSQILLYGWANGGAGFENKHELPPQGQSDILETDSSERLLFGDIFLLKQIDGKLSDFEISEYGDFYTLKCGGFDDCETTDEEYENNTSSEEDEEYVPDKDFEEDDDIEQFQSDDLELDTNNY